MNRFDDSWIPTQHISTLLLEYVSFFSPKLPPAFYFTESNPWSTHAPPTVWANLNLPVVSVFSHPPPPTWHPRLFHLHPKYQPRVTCFPALLLRARIFVSLTHSRREHAHERLSQITWLIPPPMLVGRNFFPASCGPCNFPFSLSWTGVVTYKPSRSCPPAALAHVKLFGYRLLTAVCHSGVNWWSWYALFCILRRL